MKFACHTQAKEKRVLLMTEMTGKIAEKATPE